MIDLHSVKAVLTFFAHPDDETLAAGATISKLVRLGKQVHVAIPATGIHSRRNLQTNEASREKDLMDLRTDCEKAMKVLGIEPSRIYLGHFADNEMDRYSLLEIIHWLEEIIHKVKPDLIITHHRYCTNIDHQRCHEAVVVAARPGIGQHTTILCGEVPSSTGYLRPTQWEPNLYVEITSEDLDRKVTAMETYKGEARPDPHPRSRPVLEALAKVRGSESGYFFAESFMIQKTFL